MNRARNRIAAAEMNVVAVSPISPIDLFIVDLRAVRGIPVDQHDLAVDRNHLSMKSRDLRIFQYDLTDCRLAADSDPPAAQPALFTHPLAVQDRTRDADAPASGGGVGRMERVTTPRGPMGRDRRRRGVTSVAGLQVWLNPGISVAKIFPPVTAVGAGRLMVVPSPSRPCWLAPQQKAFPSALSPQVWN